VEPDIQEQLLHPQVAVGQGDGLQRLEQRRDGDARQQAAPAGSRCAG
jgi:hypothetical protein